MKKFFVLAGLLTGLVSFIYAADSSSSTATITADVTNAQIAMATSDYYVTAGDIYTIVFRGTSYSLTIDASYKLRVASLGVINVKGLTFQELKGKVESLISNNFPTENIQLYITNPAVFNVLVKGEVEKSVEVETWALGRLSKVIKPLLTEYSSIRNIKIISTDGSQKVVDLFKAERYGELKQDPYLRPDDTIIISKYDRRVKIEGAVRRPGTYDLLEGEQLLDLITIYGDGYTEDADKESVVSKRFIGGKEMWSSKVLGDAEILGNMNLYNMDKIVVGSLNDVRPLFYIEGAIVKIKETKKSNDSDSNDKEKTDTVEDSTESLNLVSDPTSTRKESLMYEYGQNYASMIRNNRKWFTNPSADLENAYIRRIVNSEKVDEEKSESDEEEISEYTLRKTLESEKIPGTVIDNKRFDDDGNEIIAINLNKILFEKGYFEEIMIQPGDTLYIPFTQYYVIVTGAVNAPGRYFYQADKDWSYYVNLANGFNQDQNIFSAVTITTKDGKKLSKKSKIPPEAVIHAQRNSPNQGWVLPLIISIITFLTTCLGLYTSISGLFK